MGARNRDAAVAYSATPAGVLTSVVPEMCAAVLTMRLATNDVCARETLGVLPTWVPATAMLPLRIVRRCVPLVGGWHIGAGLRRRPAPACALRPPLRSALSTIILPSSKKTAAASGRVGALRSVREGFGPSTMNRRHWPVGVNPSAGGPVNPIAQGSQMMVGHTHHATSLILAQPNFHYPIPASFELTQRGPTDWVCVGPRIKTHTF